MIVNIIRLDEILRTNMVLIIFFYGLVFFMLGIAIFLKYIKDSNFKMAESLGWLAGFGVIHGLAEWGDVFIPIQATYLPEHTIFLMRVLQMFMDAVSFTLLFYFGIQLGSKTYNRRLPVTIIPWAMFLIWLLLIAVNYHQLAYAEPEHWLRHGDILARYILGFPGALISGLVLWSQRSELAKLRNEEVLKNLKGTSIFLMVYALATGLVVPSERFFLANEINTAWFFATFRFPVQILRTICGLGVLYYAIGLLKIFDWEKYKRLEEAEKKQAVLHERERIARDLHDGIIQSIYAVGLNMENSVFLMKEDTGKAQESLALGMDKLNGVINEIRAYVLNLRPLRLQDQGLRQRLNDLISEFKANSMVDVDVDITDDGAIDGLSQIQVDQLYHVVREALGNVLRHANATLVQIKVATHGGRLNLFIRDNGQGFQPPEDICQRKNGDRQQGLCNMAKRVESIWGELEIKSNKARGTEIKVSIPLKGDD